MFSLNSLNLRRMALVFPPLALTVFAAYLAITPANEVWAQQPPGGPPGRAIPLPGPGIAIPAPGTFTVDPAPVVSGPRPVPVQNMVAFETAFVQRLNEAIRNPQALTAGKPKVVVLVDTKVFKAVVDTRAIVVVEGPAVVQLSTAQIADLRDTLLRQVDNAVKAELAGRGGARQLGSAVVRGDAVVGNIKTVPAI